MNIKKIIAGIMVFSMMFNPACIPFSEKIQPLCNVYAAESEYYANIDINAVEATVIYGETAVFEISFIKCENVKEVTFTLSYDSSLSYKGFETIQGTVGSFTNENNTLTISVTDENCFEDGSVIRLSFKTPDTINEYYGLSIDDVSLSNPDCYGGEYSYTSSASVYVDDRKYIEENGVEYIVYKDHALLEGYLGPDSEITIPASVQGVPVTGCCESYNCFPNVTDIYVSADNEYLSSADGVLYNKDFTELLLYPMNREDTAYYVLDSCKTIREFAFNWFSYDSVPDIDFISIPMSVEKIEDSAIYISNKMITIEGYENSEAQRYAKSNYINFYNLSTGCTESAAASGTCGENLTWSLDSDGLMTISGTGDMEHFPQQKNCADTPWILMNSHIKEIVVEEGVTSISNDAFAWCDNLEKVTLADSVSFLDYQAFYACKKLKQINLPANLREISAECFFGCSLETLTLPESLMYIRECALGSPYTDDPLFGKNTFTDIHIPAGVREISSSAFSGCKDLTNITIAENSKYFSLYEGVLYNYYQNNVIFIPYSIKTLNLPDNIYSLSYDSGFVSNNNIKTLNISSSVSEIDGYLTIYWETLENINVDDNNSYFSSQDGVLYNKDKTTLLCCPPARKSAVLVLPETVTEISSDAFSYDCGVTDIYYAGSEQDLTLPQYMNSSITIHYNSDYSYSKGDVNGDSKVNAVDLVLLKKYILSLLSDSDINISNSDMDGNGSIGAVDIVLLRKQLLS